MDLWFVTVFALVLLGVDSLKTSEDVEIPQDPTSNSTSANNTTAAPTTAPPCPSPVPTSRALLLGFLSVEWNQNCEGDVMLKQMNELDDNHVCRSSRTYAIDLLLQGVCEQKKGCTGRHTLQTGRRDGGVKISGSQLTETDCETLSIKCEGRQNVFVRVSPETTSCEVGALTCVRRFGLISGAPPEEPREPAGFKVATALLSVTLILLLFACFSKPTVKALQKRFSNKRKNRWIGPTQSQSVTYHRGQTVNKNLDGQKRSSYPALDNLVVGSRAPGSNRNSYNF
ncbi:hypothetical protein WMY93_006186 [Mugilogobius chulae]|uniref:Uncharacterized protein n=1 Tax=Mugilogobius chulae TaxID=88201 RepID=A0AAW0PN48_9GOBI